MSSAVNMRQAPPSLVQKGLKQIQELLNAVQGLDSVMLCSSDGFELALASKKNLGNTGKIAAVGSSILAMVSAFVSEIQLQGCQTITLDADNGKAVLSAVAHPQYPMLIVALAGKDVLLGQLLYSVKKAAENIAAEHGSV